MRTRLGASSWVIVAHRPLTANCIGGRGWGRPSLESLFTLRIWYTSAQRASLRRRLGANGRDPALGTPPQHGPVRHSPVNRSNTPYSPGVEHGATAPTRNHACPARTNVSADQVKEHARMPAPLRPMFAPDVHLDRARLPGTSCRHAHPQAARPTVVSLNPVVPTGPNPPSRTGRVQGRFILCSLKTSRKFPSNGTEFPSHRENWPVTEANRRTQSCTRTGPRHPTRPAPQCA